MASTQLFINYPTQQFAPFVQPTAPAWDNNFVAEYEQDAVQRAEEIGSDLSDCARDSDFLRMAETYATAAWEMENYGTEFIGCGDAALFYCIEKNTKGAISLLRLELLHPNLHLCVSKDSALDRILELRIKNHDEMELLKLFYEYIPPVTSHVKYVFKRLWPELFAVLLSEYSADTIIFELANNIEAIKCILAKGIDVNANVDEHGNTILHKASLPNLISLLAKCGISLNKRNNYGDTALHCAVKLPITDQLYARTAALLSAGASPLVTDSYGLTPRQYLLRCATQQPSDALLKTLQLLQYFEEDAVQF